MQFLSANLFLWQIIYILKYLGGTSGVRSSTGFEVARNDNEAVTVLGFTPPFELKGRNGFGAKTVALFGLENFAGLVGEPGPAFL